ncbi:YdeI/OmpD-associated family protein [Tsukamurella serpentis]
MATAAVTVRFTGTAERIGDRTVLRLPEQASGELPSRGQVAATGSADGARFRTVVEPDGRRGHWLDLDGIVDTAEFGPGDSVRIELTPTKDWPEPVLPDDLAAALADAPDTADSWSDITPMARWEWVRWVGATRSPATRAKRVQVTISKLRDGKRRPCCFDLSSCTDPELARSGKLIE